MTQLPESARRKYGTPQEFIAHVRRQLATNGISQRKLAAQAGMDPRQLNAWLCPTQKGHWNPSLANVIRLDEALSVLLYG